MSAQPLRMGRRHALAASIVGTGVALALMYWARSAYQIRTLPERLMEWALLFVPPNLFEKGVQTLDTAAKEIALAVAYVGMAGLLLVVGVFVVRKGTLPIVVTTIGLWLFAMAVIMPITGAGLFATKLFQDVLLTNVSYAGVALSYGTFLLLARALAPAPAPSLAGPSRRAFVGGVVGTGLAYVLTFWLGRSAGTVTSSLPLASAEDLAAPTPVAAATQAPAPTSSGAAAAGTPSAPSATAAPTPASAQAAATSVPTRPAEIALPAPPSPPRQLNRDKDGSLTRSGRKPGELASPITPNADWYITTKNAGGDPALNRDQWRLVVDGEVNKPVQLDIRTVYKLPAVEITKSQECISNFVSGCEQVPFGCDLISTARWKGVRLADILRLAGGLKEGIQSIALFGSDEFSSSIPPDPELLAEALLVYEMNGEVLPYEHGYPARLLVPGRYGFKSTKWLVGIRPMREEYVDYYGQRNWTKDAIVKTMTRIDVPALDAQLAPGEQRIAGIAYAGTRGISKVEFSADGMKTWHGATLLEPPAGKDTWVRWEGAFKLAPGATVQLAARAVDGTGARQIEEFHFPDPDGATGMETLQVTAKA